MLDALTQRANAPTFDAAHLGIEVALEGLVEIEQCAKVSPAQLSTQCVDNVFFWEYFGKTNHVVEDVQVQHVFEAGARFEGMAGVVGLKGEPVGTQSVVVEMPKVVPGFGAVSAGQAALNELVELLFVGERRLVESHFSAPGKK